MGRFPTVPFLVAGLFVAANLRQIVCRPQANGHASHLRPVRCRHLPFADPAVKSRSPHSEEFGGLSCGALAHAEMMIQVCIDSQAKSWKNHPQRFPAGSLTSPGAHTIRKAGARKMRGPPGAGLRFPMGDLQPTIALAIAVSNAGAMGALASLGSPEAARNEPRVRCSFR